MCECVAVDVQVPGFHTTLMLYINPLRAPYITSSQSLPLYISLFAISLQSIKKPCFPILLRLLGLTSLRFLLLHLTLVYGLHCPPKVGATIANSVLENGKKFNIYQGFSVFLNC